MSKLQSGSIPMDVAPYRLSGRVYGTLLNHRSAVAALGDAISGPPYKAAPKAPVLYIKPRNTLNMNGMPVYLPADAPELEAAACVGLVIGRTACNLPAAGAIGFVAGYLIVNDVSVPHSAFYRPSIRFKARDGFCPLGPRVVPRDQIENPEALGIRVYVDGTLVQTATTADLVRPIGQLLADVTDFMTLSPGDVLAIGAAAPVPRVRAGQVMSIEVDGLGRLETHFAAGVS
jgi:5-oxopent-3-ene-1,2,5-tricarboxylate decarboxylase / 2-hydroxyhepta-2,4-diene-1,7-dioate isomerase